MKGEKCENESRAEARKAGYTPFTMILIKNLSIAIIGIVLAIVLYSVFANGRFVPSPMEGAGAATTTLPLEDVDNITYRNNTYGITFSYPENYVMEQHSQSDDGSGHASNAIVLIRQTDMPTPANGEGPPAITIEIHEAKLQTLFDWLEKGNSNYSPDNGMSSSLASTTVYGFEAVQYTWSGLYGGETTAFVYEDDVIAVSVTYLAPEDQNVAVYRNLLQSLVLQ